MNRFFLYATSFCAAACVACTSDTAKTTTTATTAETTVASNATPTTPDSATTTGPAVTPTSHTDSVVHSDTAPRTAPRVPPGKSTQDGATVLVRTAAKYKTISTMRADFTMRVENPLLRSSATTRGTLYSKRPDRIALRFTDPSGDVILSDGEYFWVYTPSSMKDQVIRTPAAPGSNAVDLQAQFVGDPVKRFRYTVSGTETVEGHVTDIINLIPNVVAPYQWLKVWIDRDDSLVRRFEVSEQSGVLRHLDLANLRINGAVDPSVFRFKVPAGVRVVGQ